MWTVDPFEESLYHILGHPSYVPLSWLQPLSVHTCLIGCQLFPACRIIVSVQVIVSHTRLAHNHRALWLCASLVCDWYSKGRGVFTGPPYNIVQYSTVHYSTVQYSPPYLAVLPLVCSWLVRCTSVNCTFQTCRGDVTHCRRHSSDLSFTLVTC